MYEGGRGDLDGVPFCELFLGGEVVVVCDDLFDELPGAEVAAVGFVGLSMLARLSLATGCGGTSVLILADWPVFDRPRRSSLLRPDAFASSYST